jgi:flagellar hook assembly protein FlgD
MSKQWICSGVEALKKSKKVSIFLDRNKKNAASIIRLENGEVVSAKISKKAASILIAFGIPCGD